MSDYLEGVPRVLALDPGGTTGWAVFDPFAPEACTKWSHGQIGPEEHHSKLWSLLGKIQGDLIYFKDFMIVYESFEYRNGLPKAELISNEYIGITRLFGKLQGVDTVPQTASMGKLREDKPNKKGSFVQKRHLEKLGLWSSGNVHAMDAYGHLIYYMIHGNNSLFKPIRAKLLEVGWKPDAK